MQAIHPPSTQSEAILFLHGSASGGALWRRTIEAMQARYHTHAPDLIGYGGSDAWPSNAPFSLDDEVDAIRPILSSCDCYHLVGYSYGGVVALQFALAEPQRVLTLTLIEPVFFSALVYAGETDAYDAFCQVRDNFSAARARGAHAQAMKQFIEFWNGIGSWDALSFKASNAMLGMVDKIALDWEASFAANPGVDRLMELASRTLLIRGDRSPAPMQSLVDALHRLMPGSERMIVSGADHLSPLTHGGLLTNAIKNRLDQDSKH